MKESNSDPPRAGACVQPVGATTDKNGFSARDVVAVVDRLVCQFAFLAVGSWLLAVALMAVALACRQQRES